MFLPAPPRFRENCLAILLHFVYHRAGRARLFMPRAQMSNSRRTRGQIDSFLREPVIHFASVRLFDSAVMIPAACSLRRRFDRIFVAIPSPDFLEFLKCAAIREPSDRE